MKTQINSIHGNLLFEGDFSCIADAVTAAVTARANLQSADLQSADLQSADLQSADLRYADLQSANLQSANLQSANLQYAKNSAFAIAATRILPEGTLIGWKKLCGDIIAKLEIPEDAKRSHAFGRKCRAEYAKVLAMFDGEKKVKGPASSLYDSSFTYEVGQVVKPTKKFDEDFTDECSTGIHFYITRLEAEAHT